MTIAQPGQHVADRSRSQRPRSSPSSYPRNAALILPFPPPASDPKGDKAAEFTIAAMMAMIHSCRESPYVAKVLAKVLALSVTSPTPRQGVDVFLDKLYVALRRWVRFDKDPARCEMVRHPDIMLAEILSSGRCASSAKFRTIGDCDDMAVLGCALIQAFGLRPTLITIATAPPPDDVYRHVFFGVRMNGELTPMDPQEGFTPGTMAAHTRIATYEL